jgi:hypothetical protein
MVKKRFTKDNAKYKKDDIIESDEAGAKVIVEEGWAVYEKIRQLEEINKQKEEEARKQGLTEEEILFEILENPNIFQEITEIELNKKIVGEIEARQVIFLCACGRLVENCQIASYNLLVNDEAGSGKDYITSKTLDLIPKEQYVKKTRISPAVFTYWHNSKFEPDWDWNGKVFYTEDISESVLNSEVFKVMCSSGSEATIVIKQQAIDMIIKGKPVMITTTANSVPNPELTRRFEILHLDNHKDQTKAIMERHAKFAVMGISQEYDEKYNKAMALLKRVKVKIPYAEKLFELFPYENVMMRTKFPRFLDMIKASAAFHQYQRGSDIDGFLLASKQDYEIAIKIMKKLISNKYCISLTKVQKKIVDYFEEHPETNLSVSRIRSELNNFISLPAFQTNLSILSNYGLLKSEINSDSLNRDVETFRINKTNLQLNKLSFPSWEVLMGDGKDSKVS